MKNIEALNNSESNQIITNYIKSKKKPSKVRILEAGCGRVWPYNLTGLSFELIGVDKDQEALKFRKENVKDLDEAIVADLEKIELEHNSFDIIYNSFLLEHIKNADKVIEKFVNWLNKDGLLIIKVPNRQSVFGFIARFTPFWIHILYHRKIVKNAEAGKDGFGPYPTYYHPVISIKGMQLFCKKFNLEIVKEFYIKSDNPILTKICIFILNILSIRMLSKHSMLCFIIKK